MGYSKGKKDRLLKPRGFGDSTNLKCIFESKAPIQVSLKASNPLHSLENCAKNIVIQYDCEPSL